MIAPNVLLAGRRALRDDLAEVGQAVLHELQLAGA